MMTDVTELDDHLLGDLRCSSCENFLSVAPIWMDNRGKSVCGRCENGTTTDMYLRNTQYEEIARCFIFPCKYLNEGCLVKMSFRGMQVHEEDCPFLILKCQIKHCSWRGTITELKIHYGDSHKELLIQNDDVQILSGHSGCYMLVVAGFYFLTQWKCDNSKLQIKIRKLDGLFLEEDISIVFTVFTKDSKSQNSVHSVVPCVLCESECAIENEISTEDCIVNSSYLFSINASISSSSISKKEEIFKTIQCSECLTQMVPPILKCPEGHVKCVDCSGNDYEYCSDCSDDIRFTRVYELENLALSSLCTCRWEGCDTMCSVREIQAHQQICSKRLYNCLHCPEWHGFFNEVVPHHAICPGKTFECPMTCNTEAIFMGSEVIRQQECSLFAHNQLFWLIIETTSDMITEVAICNNGPPSLFGWFHYEIDLRHTEIPDFPFNKTYFDNDKQRNRYTTKIPASDTEKFGGPEFFKIIVRIILLEESDRKKNVIKHFRYLR